MVWRSAMTLFRYSVSFEQAKSESAEVVPSPAAMSVWWSDCSFIWDSLETKAHAQRESVFNMSCLHWRHPLAPSQGPPSSFESSWGWRFAEAHLATSSTRDKWTPVWVQPGSVTNSVSSRLILTFSMEIGTTFLHVVNAKRKKEHYYSRLTYFFWDLEKHQYLNGLPDFRDWELILHYWETTL